MFEELIFELHEKETNKALENCSSEEERSVIKSKYNEKK
jgi:hypothetical protein